MAIQWKQWTRHGVHLLALTLVGCSGGGGGDSNGNGVVPSEGSKHTKLEDYIYYQGRFSMASQTKVYKGAFSPLDLTLTQPRSGKGISEVNVAGQETDNSPFNATQINGHRVHFSDGAFIDFKCNQYAFVTFPPDAKKLLGTFQADYRIGGFIKESGQYDYTIFIQLENRVRYEEVHPDFVTDLVTYSGYEPSLDTYEVQEFTLNYIGSVKGPIVVNETSGGFPALSNIKVTRIEKFADDSSEPNPGETSLCGLAKEYYLPDPGFDTSGPSYTGLSPWGCWGSVVNGRVWGGEITAKEQDNCVAWSLEKGW